MQAAKEVELVDRLEERDKQIEALKDEVARQQAIAKIEEYKENYFEML